MKWISIAIKVKLENQVKHRGRDKIKFSDYKKAKMVYNNQ